MSQSNKSKITLKPELQAVLEETNALADSLLGNEDYVDNCIIIDGESIPLTSSNETIQSLYAKGDKC